MSYRHWDENHSQEDTVCISFIRYLYKIWPTTLIEKRLKIGWSNNLDHHKTALNYGYLNWWWIRRTNITVLSLHQDYHHEQYHQQRHHYHNNNNYNHPHHHHLGKKEKLKEDLKRMKRCWSAVKWIDTATIRNAALLISPLHSASSSFLGLLCR